MKINKLGVILGLVITSTSYADTNIHTHDVEVTVPNVALLDVADANSTITCSVPGDEAGANMTCTNSEVMYEMTSNVKAHTQNTRTITASLSENIDPSWKLQITPTIPTEPGEDLGIANTGDDVNFAGVASTDNKVLVTGIKNGATTAGKFTYTLEPTNGAALAYREAGASDITVTYTITADQ